MLSQTLPDRPVTEGEASLVKTDANQSNSSITTSPLTQVLEVGGQITAIIDQIPQYWHLFWQAYRRPLALLGWVLAALIVVKVAVAVLITINGIPLLAPLLTLVGLSYSLWFGGRNFFSFARRQQIFARLDDLKSYIWGTNVS
jgi:hypothetical protein